MLKPTIITWIIAGFGSIIFILLLATQLVIIIKPKSTNRNEALFNPRALIYFTNFSLE